MHGTGFVLLAAALGLLVTSRRAQRRRLPTVAAVAAAGVLGHLVRGLWRPVPGRTVLLWLVFVLAAYAAAVGWGAVSQARRAQVRSLQAEARRAEAEQAARIVEAQLTERDRIAREVHDVLAQRLSGSSTGWSRRR